MKERRQEAYGFVGSCVVVGCDEGDVDGGLANSRSTGCRPTASVVTSWGLADWGLSSKNKTN